MDYSGKNLRGKSFKGQNLAGANFSHADIRSTNFTGANLKGANFTGAKAGLQKRWALLLVLLSWLLSGISGFLFLFNSSPIAHIFDSSGWAYADNHDLQFAGWVTLIATIIVYIIIIRKGISVNLAFAFALAIAGTFTGTLVFSGGFSLAAAFVGGFAFAAAVGFAIAVAVAVAIAGVVAVAVAVAGSFFAFAFAFTERFLAGTFVFAFAFAFAGTVVSAYIAWRAMKGDEKYALVRNAAVAFAAIGGTSFRGADLTDANFTSARLKSTDFRKAELVRTCFHKTKLLDRVQPGTSYLKHLQVRQLILTGQGQDKNFDRLDLRGINLKAAFLTDASFIGTDLSEAYLQDADLSRAKLVQTQLDDTDFTGATLTGAYIQDWNITHETNFRNVRCEYVYMRFPTKENPNPLRKPDNNDEVFADGDFGDFIQPIFDTLDLYHNQGVDPRAIAISFKELAENNPDAELEIVAMEKRGEDKFLLRAKTAPEADKSELSSQYFETYNQIKGLPESQIKLLLAEKDNRILALENMVTTALESPRFYTGNYHNQGDTTVGNNRDIKIDRGNYNERIQGNYYQNSGISQNMSGGTMHGGMQAAAGDNNNQQMETNVTQPNEKQLTQANVIQMLAQIEELVNSTPELPEAEKEKSLRYLGAAKEETQEQNANKQLAAQNLKSMAQTIETTSKTVESGKTLWENVKPILKELPAYFGVAKTFFGL